MVDSLDLADAARARMQRRQLRLPFARVGGYADNAAVDNMGVDDTAAAAVVAAGAGDDGLVRFGRDPRSLVDCPSCHYFLSSAELPGPLTAAPLSSGRIGNIPGFLHSCGDVRISRSHASI